MVCAEVFAFILIICVHSQCHTLAFLEASQRCGARDRTEVASLEAKRRKVKTMDLLYKVKSKVDVDILKFICTY